jgi:hypothetical protein
MNSWFHRLRYGRPFVASSTRNAPQVNTQCPLRCGAQYPVLRSAFAFSSYFISKIIITPLMARTIRPTAYGTA